MFDKVESKSYIWNIIVIELKYIISYDYHANVRDVNITTHLWIFSQLK